MVNNEQFKISFSLFLHSLNNNENFNKTKLIQLKQLVDQSEGELSNELLVIYNQIVKDPTLLFDYNIYFQLNDIYNRFFKDELMESRSENNISIRDSSNTSSKAEQVDFSDTIDKSTSIEPNIVQTVVEPITTSSNSINEHITETTLDDSETSSSYIAGSFEFTRPDGSILKITPISCSKNIYFSNLNKYKVEQQFPHLGNFSTMNFIYTSINMNLLHISDSYSDIIKNSLSAQNIYNAATEHFGFLYSDNPTFNSSSSEMLSTIELECMRDCLKNRPPFSIENGILKRLIPITIFSTSSGVVSQLEYHLTGLNISHSNLKYVFTNIDYKKLCENSAYRNIISDKLEESEKSLQGSSSNSTYFEIDYNSLTEKYFTVNDKVQSEMINSYINYVTSLQTSVDNTSPKHNSSDGR